MKHLFTFFILLSFFTVDANAQKKPRLSPMDSVSTEIRGGKTIKIVYSRPTLRERALKDIITFGEVWRTGANEATTFETDSDLTIEGKRLPAGKYSLYTIPAKTQTTVIFNKNWDQWGTKYDEDFDALRIKVPTRQAKRSTEQLTIDIRKNGTVSIDWEKMQINFKVK
ncbi:DUF2911 domain-containing protein [Haoranjiania flava]|uniref:DUF2911 domain-containing protein n=1 Tax=Haoranjiania flava TaxID=1856322 RepID=A0AAE3INV6_9BACT|nr:DUF2911 domain-containing protein [Haoranjiania flava]MCU7695358.1 DUF2911 domain-containing protein [Haoranjiania flava]